jgi:hypothetical protein
MISIIDLQSTLIQRYIYERIREKNLNFGNKT